MIQQSTVNEVVTQHLKSYCIHCVIVLPCVVLQQWSGHKTVFNACSLAFLAPNYCIHCVLLYLLVSYYSKTDFNECSLAFLAPNYCIHFVLLYFLQSCCRRAPSVKWSQNSFQWVQLCISCSKMLHSSCYCTFLCCAAAKHRQWSGRRTASGYCWRWRCRGRVRRTLSSRRIKSAAGECWNILWCAVSPFNFFF